MISGVGPVGPKKTDRCEAYIGDDLGIIINPYKNDARMPIKQPGFNGKLEFLFFSWLAWLFFGIYIELLNFTGGS